MVGTVRHNRKQFCKQLVAADIEKGDIRRYHQGRVSEVEKNVISSAMYRSEKVK